MTTEQELQRFDFQPRPVRDDPRAGTTMLYRDLDGVRTPPVSGADGFAFFKDPPVVSLATMWRAPTVTVDAPTAATINALPAVTDISALELLEPVNVAGQRALNLFVRFWATSAAEPPLPEAQLYLVLFAACALPQQEALPDGATKLWAPVGILDPTVRGTDAGPFSLDPPASGFRNAYQSQINIRGTTVATFNLAAPINTLALTLDVSPYNEVRLGVGASLATSTAGIHYELVR